MPVIEKTCLGETATFWLKDYLGPNGVYKYETLAPTMEEHRRLGYHVVLLSVPRFTMLTGFPDEGDTPSEYPWFGDSEMYKTAQDGLSIKNGLSMFAD